MSVIARPNLRGFLGSSAKKHAVIGTVVSFVAAIAWKAAVCDTRKQSYADFHKSYNDDKAFERMKRGGIFQSVNPDGSRGEGW